MKYVLIVLTLVAAMVIVALNMGYGIEKMEAVDLPGFTTGQYYVVQGISDPGYGLKFKVTNDKGDVKILSPWHFGYNFQ